MQPLDFILQGLVDSTHILQMPLADLQVFPQLLIHIQYLVIFGDNEVDFRTGLLQLVLSSSRLLSLLLQLLAKSTIFLLFTGEQLHFLANLVLHASLFQLFRSYVELQLLAVLFLVLQLALINRDSSVQLGNAAIQFTVLVLKTRKGLIKVGLLTHKAADVALGLVALFTDGFTLSADSCVLAATLFHFLPQLAQLQSSPFLLHLLHISQAFLFLEADACLSGLIFLAIFKGNQLLCSVFGIFEGLSAEPQFLLKVLCLQPQLTDISS